MARRERPEPKTEKLERLLSAGDYAGVRRAVRGILLDPTSTENERAGAARMLSRLRPDPGAVWVGIVSVLIALGVSAFTLIRGAH